MHTPFLTTNQSSSDDDIAFVGHRLAFEGETPFGLHPTDRRQHTYAIGKTGSGKSTLLRNLFLQDVHAGRGVGLIDPHGDLAIDLLDHIPPNRTDDVVYFNPSDFEHPIGFNLFTTSNHAARHQVASGIVTALKSIWRESWGPRLEVHFVRRHRRASSNARTPAFSGFSGFLSMTTIASGCCARSETR